MMFFLASWVAFTAICLLASHLALRAHYGSGERLWLWIEYIWCGLSLIALCLAAIQLNDKSDAIALARYRIAFNSTWSSVRSVATSILRDSDDPLLLSKVRAQYPIVAPSADKLPSSMKRISGRDREPIIEAHYTDFAGSFCSLIFGKNFNIATIRREARSYDSEEPSDAESVYISYLRYCAGVYDLAEISHNIKTLENDSRAREPIYNIAYLWSYLLSLGISLKFTKTTSDLRAWSRSKNIARKQ
jgi:hypothetical protein